MCVCGVESIDTQKKNGSVYLYVVDDDDDDENAQDIKPDISHSKNKV